MLTAFYRLAADVAPLTLLAPRSADDDAAAAGVARDALQPELRRACQLQLRIDWARCVRLLSAPPVQLHRPCARARRHPGEGDWSLSRDVAVDHRVSVQRHVSAELRSLEAADENDAAADADGDDDNADDDADADDVEDNANFKAKQRRINAKYGIADEEPPLPDAVAAPGDDDDDDDDARLDVRTATSGVCHVIAR